MHLRHVSVDYETSFELRDDETPAQRRGTYCRIRCQPESDALHELFVELLAATLKRHPARVSAQEIDRLVDSVIEIFRPSSQPNSRTVTGLWGELLLIYVSSAPAAFVDGWRTNNSDSYDFDLGSFRIEVKTSCGGQRTHDFSLSQAGAARVGDLVASVLLTGSSRGLGIISLAREVAAKVDAARQSKLWRVVVQTIGELNDRVEDGTYDLRSAIESLRLVHAKDVPAPRLAEPESAYISNVRFTANISEAVTSKAIPFSQLGT